MNTWINLSSFSLKSDEIMSIMFSFNSVLTKLQSYSGTLNFIKKIIIKIKTIFKFSVLCYDKQNNRQKINSLQTFQKNSM